MKNFIYIANWKSYFTYDQSVTWLKIYGDGLNTLAEHTTIILCPDFLTLATACSLESIRYGAQNCSAYSTGAYTGEISAQSLSELGVSYCIVGHSERRRLFHETLDDLARKITMLFTHNITPIICVSDDYTNELQTILPCIQEMPYSKKQHLVIAYEPVSAIGTGNIPSPETIAAILIDITCLVKRFLNHISYSLIYGGSVSSVVISELKKIPTVDGFLIGKASTDFQELKNIVEYK